MVTVVQGVEKLTAKVPLVLLVDATVKVLVPPAVTVCDVGVTERLLGLVTVIVAAVLEATVIEAEAPPFLRILSDEGFEVTVQPLSPVPVIGGPLVPDPPSVQSATLLRAVDPVTTVDTDISPDVFTEEKLAVGRTSTSLLTVTSPAADTSTQD